LFATAVFFCDGTTDGEQHRALRRGGGGDGVEIHTARDRGPLSAMASQTMTRKLSFTSPWKSTGGPGTFTYQQPSSSTSASNKSATAPPQQLRNPGDLGPVSMHIRTTETKVPYIGETKNRMEFGSVPKGEYSSPIKMGMHKKSNSDASLRAYNPTHTFHTMYDGPGGATARPNSMSFTQVRHPTYHCTCTRHPDKLSLPPPPTSSAAHGARSLPQQHPRGGQARGARRHRHPRHQQGTLPHLILLLVRIVCSCYVSGSLVRVLHHHRHTPRTTGHGALTLLLTPLLCQFGPGFYRRHPTHISNPRADVIKAHGTEWAARAQTINEVHVFTVDVHTPAQSDHLFFYLHAFRTVGRR